MAKLDPLAAVPEEPEYLLPATREQVAKLSEFIHDAGRYRRALRSFGYDTYPDGGEISTLETEALMMWLMSAARKSLERSAEETAASV